MATFPKTIVAIDVETTGLHSKDRVVSFGAWRVDVDQLDSNELDYKYIHFIADPGKKSHPRAEEVHGYSDWVLRHQQPFTENIAAVREIFSGADVLIAHNASFDMTFVEREFAFLGEEMPKLQHYCTMNGYRRSGLSGRASLAAICETIGLRRIEKKHGALEDAWLALMVYFWLHKAPTKFIMPFEKAFKGNPPLKPSNFREPPALPDGPLPRRKKKSKEIIEETSARELENPMKSQLAEAVTPTATLLMAVAGADKSLQREEIDIIVSLIRDTRDRLKINLDDKAEIEIAADLLDLEISDGLLDRAAKQVYADDAAREAFPKWIAAVSRADGNLSAQERLAIDKIKASISKAIAKN